MHLISTKFCQLTSRPFVRGHSKIITSAWRTVQPKQFYRLGRSCLLRIAARIVQHRSDAAVELSGNDDIALLQLTVLHQHRRNRTTASIQPRFDYDTLGRCFVNCRQFQQFRLQRYRFQQFVHAFPGDRRDLLELHVTAPSFWHQILRRQLIGHAIRVSAFKIHLVDRNNDRHLRRLCVLNRFNRLRHHSVISSNHKNHDIGHFRTACTHRGKCRVSGRINKGDLTVFSRHAVGTDMLGDATGFARGHP